MMDNVIKIGDEVNWRGAWGNDDFKTAKVNGITLSESPYCHIGEEVFSVKHWAYADQIAPVGHDPTDWHKEI